MVDVEFEPRFKKQGLVVLLELYHKDEQ